MNFLQIFFIISGIIILLFSIDIAKKKKFNALHFLVFISIWFGLLIFTIFPNTLNSFWLFFGLQRWADALVYAGIIFLVYFSLLLLRKTEENSENMTSLIREMALQNSEKKIISWKEIILIRAFNEWPIIAKTIQEVLNAWYKNILIINDGSSDNTVSEIMSLNSENITLLQHYKNRWWWAALETWFEYIRRYSDVKYIITFDADGQHDVSDIAKVEWYLKDHKSIDVLIGSRFMGKKQIGMPITRKMILKLGIIFTFFLSNITLSDSHNGFRVFRRKVLDEVYLTNDDMSYASELIDIISSKKIAFKEIPVHIKYTQYSLEKGQKNGNAINIALRMIWNKFFK